MKVRETIGTGVRTIVKVEVITDGDQLWLQKYGRGEDGDECSRRGVRKSVVATCAAMIYSPV